MLAQNLKVDIQMFVYFLFKGTLHEKLLFSDFNYVDVLLNNQGTLYNCFEIFVFANRKQLDDITGFIANYIIMVCEKNEDAYKLSEQAISFNVLNNNDFWVGFLKLAKCFCFNLFEDKINNDYLKGLDGCGSDALPAFAVWSNCIEINNDMTSVNAEFALKRSNERMKFLFDGIIPKLPFSEQEIEQELY